MIISRLQGGLGNQLFQWAYGKSLSNLWDQPYCLDLNCYYSNSPSVTRRSYELKKLNISTPEIIDIVPTAIRVSDNFQYRQYYADPSQNHYLDGYWQSEKYFKQSENLIRTLLQPSEEVLLSLLDIVNLNEVSVSLHIRRTDYLSSNNFHPMQNLDYYNKGLKTIRKYDKLYVVSDDIKWCKNNLEYDNMVFVENTTNVQDLYIMSMCHHNIIANSSFSWWGAWLNCNPKKIVVAPKNWFGDKTINTSDITPKDWILLD
jgi:hypothetical protein